MLFLYLLANTFATTGMIAAVTISAIAAESLLGSPTWSGLPVACSILGTACGARLLATLIERLGTGRALAAQYLSAVPGAAIAILALAQRNVLLLAAGLFALGLGNGASQYVRYLAADALPPERRARALSWVVFVGSIGAVAGPALLAPSERLRGQAALPEYAGPYLTAGVAFVAVALLYALLHRADQPHDVTRSAPVDPASGNNRRWPTTARIALTAMIVGHVVMVFVMTMTPVHLSGHGHPLGHVGFVISSHIAGMFLFAPLVGVVTDRFGPRRVLLGGATTLALACVLAALAAEGPDQRLHLPMAVPLFLLGLGWNLGFVAGSSMLSSALPEAQRLRGRAFADACVWVAAATASLSSSVLFGAIGFERLSWLGTAASLSLLTLLVVNHRSLRSEAAQVAA